MGSTTGTHGPSPAVTQDAPAHCAWTSNVATSPSKTIPPGSVSVTVSVGSHEGSVFQTSPLTLLGSPSDTQVASPVSVSVTFTSVPPYCAA